MNPAAGARLVYFRGNSLPVQRAVARRFHSELRDALAELADERGGKR